MYCITWTTLDHKPEILLFISNINKTILISRIISNHINVIQNEPRYAIILTLSEVFNYIQTFFKLNETEIIELKHQYLEVL